MRVKQTYCECEVEAAQTNGMFGNYSLEKKKNFNTWKPFIRMDHHKMLALASFWNVYIFVISRPSTFSLLFKHVTVEGDYMRKKTTNVDSKQSSVKEE